jgi:hypothetical protein
MYSLTGNRTFVIPKQRINDYLKMGVYPGFATLIATIFTTSYRDEGLFGCHASTRMGPV